MSNAFSVQGKQILISGGTGGLGRAITLQLARGGADVIVNHFQRVDAAASLTAVAEEEGLKVRVVRADLTTQEGRSRINDTLSDGLSGFIHCAATGVHRPIEQLTTRHFDFTFALNLRAFLETVQLLLPRLASGSSVVALSSEGAAHAIPHYSLIGASKGGLEALCRHMAVELAPKRIRVNVLSPGSTPTGAWDAFPNKERRLQEAARRSPDGQLTTPEEVAWAAQFLCSDASSGVNGHVLVVDRGARVVG